MNECFHPYLVTTYLSPVFFLGGQEIAQVELHDNITEARSDQRLRLALGRMGIVGRMVKGARCRRREGDAVIASAITTSAWRLQPNVVCREESNTTPTASC